MPIPVDLVVTFKGTSRPLSKPQPSKDVQSAEEEYTRLINTLTTAGLKATGRRGEKLGLLMILIWTPPRRLAQLSETQRHADFLLGLPSSLPGHSPDPSAVSPLSHADRLRLVHDYVTSLKIDGGLGIIPGISQWPRVESILALQDPGFNHAWITSWTRCRIGFDVGFSELNKIRDEFGEAVSLYFAFLSSYTQALFFPSAVGLLFWFFSSPYSPWYSVILTMWSVWWVEWWSIREKELSVRWGTLGSFRAEKRRPQFQGEKGKPGEDNVAYAFPWWKRELRIVASLPIILFFAGVLATLLTAIFIVEAFVTQFYQGPLQEYISLTPSILFAALVPRVLGLYQTFVRKLTNWENHDHQSSYDASLTMKTFALSAIVAYLGLALSAFVYVPFGHMVMGAVQNYVVHVADRDSVKSLFDSDIHKAQTKIDPSRLQNQMFAFTVTNQAVDTLTEIVLPYVMRVVVDVKNGKGFGGLRANKQVVFDDDRTAPVEERRLLDEIRRNIALPEYSLFGDYAEMITQFGYVALWSNIWPLAPVMALLNNWLELRSDAFKIATHNRRPLPVRVDTIGPWLDSMAFISWFGALTNSALVYIFRPQDTGPFTARFGTTVDATGQPGLSSTWHALMVPALLIALSSSHAYMLARSIMRHIIHRAIWKSSNEERVLQRAQDEVKSFYLNKVRTDEEMSELAVAQLTQGSQAAAGQSPFWDQDDGLEELRQAFKTA